MTAARSLSDPRIASFVPTVRSLAARLAMKSGGAVDVADLIGAGTVGLVDAATRFDESRGIPFEAYVRARVQGAMLDALRAEDYVSRGTRRKEAARGGESRTLPKRLAFVPLEDAEHLAADERSPADAVEQARAVRRLRAAIETLPERDRTVLSLYYEEGLKYREIGTVLAITESRVCQVLRGIQDRLRRELNAA